MSDELTNKLSDRAKENLRRNEEQRARDSKYIKLEPGEKKELIFDPEKMETEISEFEGKPRMRYLYVVVDPRFPDNEKIFTTSKMTSERIDKELAQGHRRVVIERKGFGLKTQYLVYTRD
jgi:hypothetical protein